MAGDQGLPRLRAHAALRGLPEAHGRSAEAGLGIVETRRTWLGPPVVVPSYRFSILGEGSLAKTDYRKKGTLSLASVLEDLVGEKRVNTTQTGAYIWTKGCLQDAFRPC